VGRALPDASQCIDVESGPIGESKNPTGDTKDEGATTEFDVNTTGMVATYCMRGKLQDFPLRGREEARFLTVL
jgi:hypothetical protein